MKELFWYCRLLWFSKEKTPQGTELMGKHQRVRGFREVPQLPLLAMRPQSNYIHKLSKNKPFLMGTVFYKKANSSQAAKIKSFTQIIILLMLVNERPVHMQCIDNSSLELTNRTRESKQAQ